MYWDLILKEIDNKNREKSPFTFTNLQEIWAQKLAANNPTIKEKKPKRIFKTYRLGEKFGDIYFTKREAECMKKLLCGKTFAKAAQELNISPRTFEFYLKNMRAKLACRTKFELVERVMQSDFIKNLDF